MSDKRVKRPKLKRIIKRQSKPRITQVLNGDFEGRSFFPWRSAGNVFFSIGRPNTGRANARFSVLPGQSASLTQTISLNPNRTYRLTFFASSPSTTGVLRVSLIGSSHPGTVFTLLSIPAGRYQRYSITFPAFTLRGRSSFDLMFRVTGSGTGAQRSILDLDTISIVPV